MRIASVAAVILVITCANAHAQNGVFLGYVTGNFYLSLNKTERTGWLLGAMDGLMAEDLLATKNPKGPWLGRCVRGLPVNQIQAIFEQELNSKPDEWHAPAALILRGRMGRFCEGKI